MLEYIRTRNQSNPMTHAILVGAGLQNQYHTPPPSPVIIPLSSHPMLRI